MIKLPDLVGGDVFQLYIFVLDCCLLVFHFLGGGGTWKIFIIKVAEEKTGLEYIFIEAVW